MDKHTPGPWSYTVDVPHTGGSDPVNMVSYRIYAQGHKRGQTHDFPCLGTLNGAGASEADAALIAAAPELLEALKAWVGAAKYSQQYGHLTDARDECADAWENAEMMRDAAIAKAEGR